MPPADREAADPIGAAEFAAWMAPLGPFGPAPALAAGVSGGPHSLALALLAAAWARARGGSLLALIADHGLRPGSAVEAASVAGMLIAQKIPARVLPLALPRGAAIQARARAARLAALLTAAGEAGRPWLLLGQHRGDQAETLLLRALAGSGADGMAGMAPVRAAPGALVLRPLLGVAAARLEATVAAHGRAPVRDPSNADRRFARVRLRATLTDPVAIDALAAAARRFGTRRARLAAAIATRLAGAATLHPEGDAILDLVALGDDSVADAALAALLRAIGGGPYAPAAAAVTALRRRGVGTLAGARLRPAGTSHHLLREAAGLAPSVRAIAGALWDGRFRLDGPGDPACTLGALGAGFASSRKLPAALLATLPAIRRNEVLEAVPLLDYPDAMACRRFRIRFAPTAGPVVAAWDMAVPGNPPHVSVGTAPPVPLERDHAT